jgi:hypothetical protein
VYFSLFFIVLIMLPSWQLHYPNKSLQAFFLPEIDVVSQNCKTQNTPLTQRVIPEQFQTPPGKSFRTLVIDLHLDSLIKFVGTKLGPEKINIYDNSDVFILPTFSENYGIVVAEALARRVPVITTKVIPWVELNELNELNCGLWVDNSNEGLKHGMLKILEHSSSKLREMGQKGRTLVENKYLWDRTTGRTIELYRWILHGGCKPDFIL